MPAVKCDVRGSAIFSGHFWPITICKTFPFKKYDFESKSLKLFLMDLDLGLV